MDVVSVVMPTYNAENWVLATIDNLLKQTYPHVELIVVDDGSQDRTVSVVREKLGSDFRNPWRIIELGANRGPSVARNVGLRAAGGSWVQFLDCDDFMAPTKFERQMGYCSKADATVTAVYSPWQRCYCEDGKIALEGELAVQREPISAPIMCLVGLNRPLQASGLARRSTLEQIGGFDESLRFWECEEINVRLARAGRMEIVAFDEPSYLWRIHRGTSYIGDEGARYPAGYVALSWIEQVLKAAAGRSLEAMMLPDFERRKLLDDCTRWARMLYVQDRPAFRKFIRMARYFEPSIAPSYPRIASVLAPVIGYEAAEGIARLGRIPGAIRRKAANRIKLVGRKA